MGNDDLGQMSAWLLFTSLGIYPVAPGSNEYVIGRPFVDSATLHLPNGTTFRIVATHLDDRNGYIKGVELKGSRSPKAFLGTRRSCGAGNCAS